MTARAQNAPPPVPPRVRKQSDLQGVRILHGPSSSDPPAIAEMLIPASSRANRAGSTHGQTSLQAGHVTHAVDLAGPLARAPPGDSSKSFTSGKNRSATPRSFQPRRVRVGTPVGYRRDGATTAGGFPTRIAAGRVARRREVHAVCCRGGSTGRRAAASRSLGRRWSSPTRRAPGRSAPR